MKKSLDDLSEERLKVMGLGNRSIRKTFYGELKRRLEELNNFRTLLDHSNDIILLLSHAGHKITDVNLNGSSILEYSKEVLVSMTFEMLLENNECAAFAPSNEPVRIFRETLITRTGRRIPAEMSVTMVRRKSVEYLVVVARDISDRLRIEEELRVLNSELELRVEERTEKLRQAHKQLMESEKMAALGSLVAGVAHEINTPIGIAFTSVTFLEAPTVLLLKNMNSGTLSRTELEAYVRKTLEANLIIKDNLQRAIDMIQHFKQIAVDQSSDEIRSVDILEYLNDVFLSLKPILRAHSVRAEVPLGLVIDTYPGALYQIFSNLLINSVIHGFRDGKKGEIWIVCRTENGRIVFDYRDNGSGIPEEHRSKIFEPFFTTRRNEGGSGLGLNIIYNLVVRKLEGIIRFEPEPRGGAHFIIEFPYRS